MKASYLSDAQGATHELAGSNLASDLIAGRIDTSHRLFQSNGLGAPSIVWAPELTDIQHPVLRRFHRFMTGAAQSHGRVSTEAFEALDLGDLEDHLMVLQVLHNGYDFRYERYGAEIAAHFGTDMTGLLTSSVHEPPSEILVQTWRRLIIPLFEPTGEIKRVAVANVPDNDLYTGLNVMPDPVLVCRRDGIVQFANSAAAGTFDWGPRLRIGMSLVDYTGLDIRLPDNAKHEASMTRAGVSRVIGIRNALLMHFEATVSTVVYRGNPIYVVVLKPL